eukprot:1156926-Pelagomonas_calceolata.AAC.2
MACRMHWQQRPQAAFVSLMLFMAPLKQRCNVWTNGMQDALATTPTGSTTRATAYGASSNPRTKGAIKRQQRQHAYLHPRFPSSSSTAELPALVHMS